MKPTNPDRWERMVKERMEKDGGLWSDSAAELLRKEHAAVVRMIRSHAKSIDGLRADLRQDFVAGYTQASAEFINQLKRRAK